MYSGIHFLLYICVFLARIIYSYHHHAISYVHDSASSDLASFVETNYT